MNEEEEEEEDFIQGLRGGSGGRVKTLFLLIFLVLDTKSVYANIVITF